MIGFRFDIDTRRGLVERTPPLLDLLARHGLPATFFCVMGPEANLLEIVRLRLLAPRDVKSKLNVAAKGGPLRIVAAALAPRGVGHRNPALLRRIVDEGHELQPHGWSHIRWQRDLANIDPAAHLARAMDALEAITGRRPDGFASPGRTHDDAALAAFDAAGLRYVGDMDGFLPFRPTGHDHLQLPVTRFETIAQMRDRGLDDDAIVDTYVEDIASHPDYCTLYEHPDDLGPAELDIFDRVFAAARTTGREILTQGEIAARWAARLPG